MSSDESDCPLCLEPMDFDDASFYPCPCLYQVCHFCWAKIINEENGLCPACRRTYDSEAAVALPPQASFESKRKPTKRKKETQPKPTISKETFKLLPELRVIQTNLVFVVGLPQWISKDKEVLKGPQYFGQFGKVFKVEVNTNQTFTGPQGQPSISAYITYCRPEDAMRAVLALDQSNMHGRQLRVSLGTTKYCSQFLRGHKCNKHECMYLHDLGDPKASFTKEQMQAGKHTEYMNFLLESFMQSLSSSSSSTPAVNGISADLDDEEQRNGSSSTLGDPKSSSVATVVAITADSVASRDKTSIPAALQCRRLGTSLSTVIPPGRQPQEHVHSEHNSEMPSSSTSVTQNCYPQPDGFIRLFPSSIPENDKGLSLEGSNDVSAAASQFFDQNKLQQISFHFPPQPVSIPSISSNYKSTETADIDFDPIRESQQGLAELMAAEMIFPETRKRFHIHQPQHISLSTQTPVSFAPPPGFEDISVNVGENVALFSRLVEELQSSLQPPFLPEFLNSQFLSNAFSEDSFNGLQDLLAYQQMMQAAGSRHQQPLPRRHWLGAEASEQQDPLGEISELLAASMLNQPENNFSTPFGVADTEKLTQLLMNTPAMGLQPSRLNGFSNLLRQSNLPTNCHSASSSKLQNTISARMDQNDMWMASEMTRSSYSPQQQTSGCEERFPLPPPPPVSSTSCRRNLLVNQSVAHPSHSQCEEFFNRHQQAARLPSDKHHHQQHHLS